MNTPTPSPVAHIVVSREDYPEFIAVSEDGYTMSADYDIYSKRLQEFSDKVAKQGGIVIKVAVKPSVLAAWCASTGRKVDSAGRAAYAVRHMDAK